MKANKIWLAVALALALVSCKSEAPKEPAHQKMKFPVAISLDGGKSGAMRATETGKTVSASYEDEREIENLTVVVFRNNNVTNTPIAVEKVITYDELTKPTDPYKGEFKFDMGMAGTFHLEVIANGYYDNEKDAFINQFKQGLSYGQFKKIVIDRELFSGGGFAMLSTEPKKVTTLANETTHAGIIKLRRLACRFDVFNKLTDELTLTNVTLQNLITASYLITQWDIPSDADGGAESGVGEFKGNGVLERIYSYENPTPGATKLLLEGTYKGQPWQKLIDFRDADGNSIVTQRNHLYRVLLTKGDGTTPGGDNDADKDNITYNIEVLDWDEDASLDYTDNDVMDTEPKSVYSLRVSESSVVAMPSSPEKTFPAPTISVHCVKQTYTSNTLLSEETVSSNDFALRLKSGTQGDVSINRTSDDAYTVSFNGSLESADFVFEGLINGTTIVTEGVNVHRSSIEPVLELRNISRSFKPNPTTQPGIGQGLGIVQFVPVVEFRSDNRTIYSTDKVSLAITCPSRRSTEFFQVSNNEVRFTTTDELFRSIRNFYVNIEFAHSWGSNKTSYNLWQ